MLTKQKLIYNKYFKIQVGLVFIMVCLSYLIYVQNKISKLYLSFTFHLKTCLNQKEIKLGSFGV